MPKTSDEVDMEGELVALRADNGALVEFAQRVIDEEEMLLGDYRAKYGPSSGKVMGVVELARALLNKEEE